MPWKTLEWSFTSSLLVSYDVVGADIREQYHDPQLRSG